MHVDYLIVGQGICGTMLSWFLKKEGKTFMVIDNGDDGKASKVAAGLMNPITGRRYAYSWLIDDVMPFAVQAYTEMGEALATKFVFKKSIIDFFPSPDMRNTFINKLVKNDTYLHSFPDQNHFNAYFNHEFGCGEISPAYTVNLQLLLASWRKQLMNDRAIREVQMNFNELHVEDAGVSYDDLTAEKIIFCDGVDGFENPWFRLLPFALNKGEALLIESPDLINTHVFKKSLILLPLPVQHVFWVGTNYIWEFEDALPSKTFLEGTTILLNQWLKVDFRVIHHKAAVRPATVERRPFVGIHPQQSAVGILNGMGTKGSSLAPFFAHQLVQHLVSGISIAPEADVQRYSRVLSK